MGNLRAAYLSLNWLDVGCCSQSAWRMPGLTCNYFQPNDEAEQASALLLPVNVEMLPCAQAAQSVYLEHARAVATAAATSALAPSERPPGQPPPESEAGEGDAMDSNSGLSWAEQQRGRDGDDFAESSPRGACPGSFLVSLMIAAICDTAIVCLTISACQHLRMQPCLLSHAFLPERCCAQCSDADLQQMAARSRCHSPACTLKHWATRTCL